jgi:hypothetical protein
MAVQGVDPARSRLPRLHRPDVAGVVRVGDEVRICPSGRTTRVARIVDLGRRPAPGGRRPVDHPDPGRRGRRRAAAM